MGQAADEELYHQARQQGGDDGALPDADDLPPEQQQGQPRRQRHAAHVEGDLHVAEVMAGAVGHHLDKGLAGVHDHVGDHRQGYAEAHDGRARQGHGYMDGVAFHRDKPRQPQAKVREPAEQKRQGDLQRLDGLKIPAQQEYMAQDQQTVLHDQTDAHGHPLKPTAHNVCHRGGR